jgi:hypothetical protein
MTNFEVNNLWKHKILKLIFVEIEFHFEVKFVVLLLFFVVKFVVLFLFFRCEVYCFIAFYLPKKFVRRSCFDEMKKKNIIIKFILS